MNARQLLPRLALALVLIAAATAAWFNRDQINLAALDAWLGSVGPWAPIAYVILYAVGTVAFGPGMIFVRRPRLSNGVRLLRPTCTALMDEFPKPRQTTVRAERS